MSSSSFGPPAACPEVPELGNGIEVTECLVSYGSMEGSLGFMASRVSGTGPETFTLRGTAYDVPAARLEITADFTDAASRRGAP